MVALETKNEVLSKGKDWKTARLLGGHDVKHPFLKFWHKKWVWRAEIGSLWMCCVRTLICRRFTASSPQQGKNKKCW